MSSELNPGTCPLLETSVGPVLVSIAVSHPRPRTASEAGITPYCRRRRRGPHQLVGRRIEDAAGEKCRHVGGHVLGRRDHPGGGVHRQSVLYLGLPPLPVLGRVVTDRLVRNRRRPAQHLRLGHPERSQDLMLDEGAVLFAGPLLDELAEQVVVGVAVRGLGPGRVEQGVVRDRPELGLPGLGASHVPDAAGHVEQLHRGDLGPLGGQLERFSIVQIITDRGVQVERVGRALALLVEEQDAEGGERLRHRTDVEPGVGLRRASRSPRCSTPYPCARATCPSVTTATEMPGNWSEAR